MLRSQVRLEGKAESHPGRALEDFKRLMQGVHRPGDPRGAPASNSSERRTTAALTQHLLDRCLSYSKAQRARSGPGG